MSDRLGNWIGNWRYALAMAIIYFIAFPLTAFTGPKGLLIAGLLLLVPLTHLVLGIVSGYKYSRFPWRLLVISAVLYIPAMLVFLNQTAWPYLPFYFILLSLGYGIGRGINWLASRQTRLKAEVA